MFIRADQTVEVGVPVGDYKAKIASGQTWYGDAVRFGPTTSYATLDAVLRFSIQGNQLLGHELVLTRIKKWQSETGPVECIRVLDKRSITVRCRTTNNVTDQVELVNRSACILLLLQVAPDLAG